MNKLPKSNKIEQAVEITKCNKTKRYITSVLFDCIQYRLHIIRKLPSFFCLSAFRNWKKDKKKRKRKKIETKININSFSNALTIQLFKLFIV